MKMIFAIFLVLFFNNELLSQSFTRIFASHVVNKTEHSDESFTDISAPLAGVAWSSVVWGDYDNDSDLDLFLSGLDSSSKLVAKIYRNDSGNFVDINAQLVGVYESSAAWGDYDNDGDLDILLTGRTNSDYFSIIYRNDSGKFEHSPILLIGVAKSSVAWGDYDNDGDLDILLTGEGRQGLTSKVYRNDEGNFVDIAASLTAVFYSSAAWGDYDNDMDLDILLTGGSTTGAVAKVYRNVNGNFSEISTPMPGVGPSSVAWGDYDNDGSLDILLTGTTTDVPVIFRNAGGAFSGIVSSLAHTAYGSAAWGDYDNDGDFDILLTGETTTNRIGKVYRNDKTDFTDIAASLPGVYVSSVAWGDYDNDGDLDFLLTGQTLAGGVHITKLFRNNISIANNVPTSPVNLTASVAGTTIALSWNKSTDRETAQNGLTYNLRVGTTPGGSEIVSPMANVSTGYRKIPRLGNTNHNARWTIKNLPAGRYYWSVQAIDNAFAGSPFAGEQSFVIGGTIDTTPPSPPQNLQATAGDKQITLKWDANSELDLLRYRIYGGIAPNPTTAIDSVLAVLGTTKIITGLNNGTKYYFRLTAVDLLLNVSGYSNEVSATPTTGPAAPNAPTNLAATPVSSTQLNLTWSDNSSNETSFEIERKVGAGGTYAVIATRPGDASTGVDNYSNTGLNPNTAYFYRVRAVLNTVTPILYSNYSNEISATTFPAIPAAASNLAASAISNSQIRLSWNAAGVTSEEGFKIYRSTSAGVAIVAGNLVGSVGINIETFTDTGLSATNTYYYKVVAFNISGNSAPSNEASATPAGDKTPPTLSAVSYAQKVNLNTDATVSLSITDLSGIKNATLYYRSGGAASFSSRAMTLQTGSTYMQTIPAATVTNRGVEFYVTAEDGAGNLSQSPSYPIQVYCPNGIANPNAQLSGKDAGAYRIFSIPLDLDNKSPAAFLNANSSLGAYDNTKYRWYGLERSTQRLQEYPNFGSITMAPDMGFALLVSLQNLKLKTGSGTTVITTKPYNITLPAGWSLIGNPFNYNIPFDSLRVSAGTFELWSFEGDWQINTAGLEPWQGYAIWLSQAATFSIRPGLAGLKSAASFYAVENNDAKNWLIQITAENGRSASRFNFVGQNELAEDEEDQFDLHQPFQLADGVELVFNQQFTTDIRQSSASGHTWELTCMLNPADEMLSLAFEGIHSIPPRFEIFLIDRETQTAYDLRRTQRLQFATGNLMEKRFQLVAGTKAYLDSQTLEAELHPANYVLLQNFPNPFNPATQIIYSLPEASHVEVSVYNLRGEAVATLVNEQQESGSHTVVWNAEKVGSGVYLIRIRAGRFESMKKCLLVK